MSLPGPRTGYLPWRTKRQEAMSPASRRLMQKDMNMSEKTQNSMAEVPFNQIYNPEDENARSELRNIPQLAESIEADGLLTAFTVELNQDPSTKEKYPYRLRAGARRYAACKALKYGSRVVPVVIVPNEDGLIKNLIENLHREDLPSIDLAMRLHDMETGDAPGAGGKKYTKKELAKRLKMSLSHVSNLIRAHKNVIPAGKKLWCKYNVPTTVVFSWAGLEEEEQEKAIAKWFRAYEKAAAREESGDGADETGGKKGKKGKEESGEEGPKPFVKGKKASQIEAYKTVLEWKLETGQLRTAVEKEAATRQIDTLRFLLGELARFPAVTAADLKDYSKWQKMEADEEELFAEAGE